MPSVPPTANLLAFEAVARRRSFALAAAELHLTASAISHQVARLESQLGVRLFERSAHGVRVSAAGQQYLERVAGALTAMFTIWIKTGKPDVAMTANGLLAGLVGITAGCAAVSNSGALAIGAIAGVLVVGSVFFFDRIKVDDPVGAVSVHGVCGAFGTLAVGLFATEGGLFYGGDVDQLVSQAIGVGAIFAFVAVTAGLLFLGLKYTIGLRVGREEELDGLDVHEHGAPGYGPDILAGIGEGGVGTPRTTLSGSLTTA